MIERNGDNPGITHEDIALARTLPYSALAGYIARGRQVENELELVRGKLAETELKLAEAQADSYDQLTGLPSRSLASREANRLFTRIGGDRLIDPISAVCTQTDIVDFKKINADHGFNGGDSFILEKANFLKGYVRDTDILSRWAGDEFVILSPVFRGSSVEQVIRELDKRLTNIPNSPRFAEQIRWDHSVWQQGDDLDAMLSRIDITTDEGKAKAKVSRINQQYSIPQSPLLK
jgi:diguanylate cyclase (GGDEF)-like protein